jgi:thiol-disulfide isomerase/thioredoxin
MKYIFFSALIAVLLTLGYGFTTRAAGYDILESGGAGGWLNVERPLTAEDMRGRIVLLDFWTYGCINCMQVVPDLTYLEEKFGDRLLIIGVHSAKFRGEQGNERILAAAKRFGLKHPVINDSDFSIWKSFGVEAWPTFVLLDGSGKEISRYAGEGHRADLEKDISAALEGIGNTGTRALPAISRETDQSLLRFPARLAFGNDMIFIADSGHNRILAVDENGTIKMEIGSGKQGFEDGVLNKASFNQPRGLVVLDSILYVADTGNHALRSVDLKSGTVATLAGNGTRGHTYDAKDEPAKTAELASPWDVDVMPDGRTLVIAMAGLHQLWTYDPARKTVSVLAGSGYENITDGAAAEAALAQPSGISVSGDEVYFVDAESSSLRLYKNGSIKTLIGTGLFDFGLKDGTYPDAMLQHPQGLFATNDIIYLADTYNNAIRVYDRKTGRLSTVSLKSVKLNEPGDILVKGSLAYVADTGAHTIKEIDLKNGASTTFSIKK